MRKLLFLFMLICTMQLHGQTVREWMGLPPVPVEFPAFGDMKNVENKIFSQADLLTLSTFNIENLTPAVGEQELQYHSLTWETATVNDNIVISQNKSAVPAIGLYAVYAENTQWMSGKLQFSFYGNAEVYVDGVKKITYTSHKGTEAVNQECTLQWVHREKLANERKRQTIFSSIYCRSRIQGYPGGFYLIPQTREKYTGRTERSQNRRNSSFSQRKIPDHGRR